MPNEETTKMKKSLEKLTKKVDSFYGEYTQHQHTGVDTQKIDSNDLGGFLSQIDVYNSATQAIANNTETLVQFNTENYDPGQEYDTTTYLFTAKTSGMYLVTSGFTYETSSSSVADKTLGLRLKKSGTSIFETFSPATDNLVTNPKLSVGITQILQLADGDTLGIYAFQNTGGSKNIISGRVNNYLSIKRLNTI